MKIALCTLYGNVNLGNKLQNYALLKIVEKSGNQVDTIVTHLTDRGLRFRFKSQLAVALSHMGVKKARKKAILWKREKRFQEFSNRHLNLSNRVMFDECNELSSKYDYFITGSDQVWHKWPCAEKTKDKDVQLKYFYLMFAPVERRISFAPSFGFEEFPEEDVEIHRQGLKQMKYLSCREESAQKLIRGLIGREALLLPDPTLCLAASEWSSIERKPQMYDLPKRFVLVYFLGNISKERQIALDLIAKYHDAEIINIYDVHHDDGIHSEAFYLTSPDEFIYLIHHAEFIATDSFHACVFSIIFHKQFRAFKREEKQMEKMFSRIDNLLSITGINNCVYHGQTIGDILSESIDYTGVDDRIGELADKAKRFLTSALNGKRI